MAITDLTGRQFGRLTVTAYAGKVRSGRNTFYHWDVECSCGRTKTVRGANLIAGNTKSCGVCVAREKAEDLTGRVFGRLTAVEKIDTTPSRWKCVCVCGNPTEAKSSNLKTGAVRSCGCLGDETRRGPKPKRWVEDASYRSAHRRVEIARGSAAEHPCVDCGGPAREWSYVGGDPDERVGQCHGFSLRYSLNPEFYLPRCVADHRRVDAETRRARREQASA